MRQGDVRSLPPTWKENDHLQRMTQLCSSPAKSVTRKARNQRDRTQASGSAEPEVGAGDLAATLGPKKSGTRAECYTRHQGAVRLSCTYQGLAIAPGCGSPFLHL
jgi:hypothetical protein